MNGRRKPRTRAERLVAAIAELTPEELALFLRLKYDAREADEDDAAHHHQRPDQGLVAGHT